MAKKTKRKVSAVVTPAPAPEVMEMSAVETFEAPRAAAPAPARSFSRRQASSAVVEFKPDYSYIIRDLKRIGTLAGTFFAILIVLSFVLPLILK